MTHSRAKKKPNNNPSSFQHINAVAAAGATYVAAAVALCIGLQLI
jgi:hypothetical protein